MPTPPHSPSSNRQERDRESLLFQEPPPEYSLLPRADETYIDAGAGAPIVRVQSPHVVVNPSDPRSHYTRQYFSSAGVPPVPPRQANHRQDASRQAASRQTTPRLPPRLNSGHEPTESAPPVAPRTHNSLPHIRDDRAYASSVAGTSSTRAQPEEQRRLERPILSAPSLDAVSGPSAQRNRSYSSGRNSHAAQGIAPNGGYPGQIAPHYPPYQAPYGAYPVSYAVVCPGCRNTGWLSSRTPCSCPVGAVASNSASRPYGSSSLLGLLDDLLNPNSRFYAPHSQQGYRGYR
ncbi:hypothetical protein H4217_004266 [Coemansia sp. RSA 1939]|nr:hypothetical protein H4217_004266 [Coemansia sp. RSA 1939]KAJ2610157.1 hypothetical protein EV177_004107 [Coemansia sp. RSA 1804]